MLILTALWRDLDLVVDLVGPDFVGVVSGSPPGTLLHMAAYVGQAAIVARLLAHGANANVELGFGTPLASVVQGTRDFLRPGSDHVAVAELLVAAGNPVEPRFLDTADGPLVAWLEERLVG